MRNIGKNGLITGIMAISLVGTAGCSANSSTHPYQKTNQFQAKNVHPVNYNSGRMVQNRNINSRQLRAPNRSASRYGQSTQPINQSANRYGTTNADSGAVPPPGPYDMFQRWVDYEPQYKLFPGDQIDVVVQTAPELSRTLTIAPDGRISMPLVGTIMAAGRTIPWLEQAIRAELAKQLVDPTTAITSRAFAQQNIYVGGQVSQQGTYALSGPIGSLEAIIMAGGFLPSAKTREVAILRRAPNGGLMMRVIDHKRGLQNVRSYADNMQLRRGDIIFVPRNSLSEIGIFVQQIRAAIPVDLSLSYNLGNNFSNNTTP
ncbi:MAG: polysaccharide export protein [Robiginitomaculum sp.]|nr:polysaccharide export protein [Robiginitomaculum sp.]